MSKKDINKIKEAETVKDTSAYVTLAQIADLYVKVDAMMKWVSGSAPTEDFPNGTSGAIQQLQSIDAGTMTALYSLHKAGLLVVPTGGQEEVRESQEAVQNFLKWQKELVQKLKEQEEQEKNGKTEE